MPNQHSYGRTRRSLIHRLQRRVEVLGVEVGRQGQSVSHLSPQELQLPNGHDGIHQGVEQLWRLTRESRIESG